MEELYTKMEREQHKFQNIINLLQKKKMLMFESFRRKNTFTD